MSALLKLFNEHGVEKAKEILSTDPYNIKMKETDNFLLLDYDQINSKRKDPIVDECRGCIIDKIRMEFACRPFDRFYNYGEFPEMEAEFDWSTAAVIEKVDGSLIKVWYNLYEDRWEIATRFSMFGDNTITTLTGEEGTMTFRGLFLRAFGGLTEDQFQSFMRSMCNVIGSGNTMLFELCTMENKVVTSYEKDTVFLLGVRRNSLESTVDELREPYMREVAEAYGVSFPERYAVCSFKEAVELANSLGGMREGFVIRDGENRRLKIKSAAYLLAHHMRGEGVTPKRAVKLALAGEVPEFLSYFPEYTEILTKYQEQVELTKAAIEIVFSQISSIENQKEFAMEAMRYDFNSILFSMRKGKTMQEALDRLTEKGLVELFKP